MVGRISQYRYLFRLLFSGFTCCMAWIVVPAQNPAVLPPKNIILMISDGCGYNQILATNYFIHGKKDAQAYEAFPVRYAMSTFPARISEQSLMNAIPTGYHPDSAWTVFDYVMRGWTDSAPAATTMASGAKTYNGAVGMDTAFQPLFSITQRAAELGKSAGMVTTVPLSHATPAGFAAHNRSRNNYAEIAREMFLDSRLSVIMGCGNPGFSNDGKENTLAKNFQYVGGKACWESLVAGAVIFSEPSPSGNYKVQDIDGDGKPDPWTLIQDRKAFQTLQKGKTANRIVGVPYVYSSLQSERKGKQDTVPFSVPFTENVPTLDEMALAALHVLNNNPKGFFLMIEGGAVDWACHDNHKARLIEEQHTFNVAVQEVIRWISAHGGWNNTLLIVTGDHECGYLTGPLPREASPSVNPMINHGKGRMPGMRFNSPDHTNQLIPLFAKGQGAEVFRVYADQIDPVRGKYLDNTELAKAMFQLWKGE